MRTPAEASGRLVLRYDQARGAKAGSLLFVGNARVEAARDVPAEGATERGALADAFGRTPAPPTGRVVEPFDQRHSGSLRPFIHLAEPASLEEPNLVGGGVEQHHFASNA
jgi:hypothetical protein